MQVNKSHIILYVSDQQKSCELYASLFDKEPILNVPGMTEFEIQPNLILGLMPNESIAKIISPTLPHPSTGNGIPRCELYLYVLDLKSQFERCKNLNFKLIDELKDRDWGDRAFYMADLDGHVIALAERM